MEKQLTAEQIQAVFNLIKYPEIDHIAVNIHSGYEYDSINISVSSVLDAKIDLVENRLLAIFPTVEHIGQPFVPESKGDGILIVLYRLNVGVENVSVTLHMYLSLEIKKAPAPTGAILENIQSDYITESEVIANA